MCCLAQCDRRKMTFFSLISYHTTHYMAGHSSSSTQEKLFGQCCFWVGNRPAPLFNSERELGAKTKKVKQNYHADDHHQMAVFRKWGKEEGEVEKGEKLHHPSLGGLIYLERGEKEERVRKRKGVNVECMRPRSTKSRSKML